MRAASTLALVLSTVVTTHAGSMALANGCRIAVHPQEISADVHGLSVATVAALLGQALQANVQWSAGPDQEPIVQSFAGVPLEAGLERLLGRRNFTFIRTAGTRTLWIASRDGASSSAGTATAPAVVSGDPYERRAALDALAGDPDAVGILHEALLADPDAQVRGRALDLVLADDTIPAALIGHVARTDAWVGLRARAIEALGRALDDPEAQAALTDVAHHEAEGALRTLARRVLRRASRAADA